MKRPALATAVAFVVAFSVAIGFAMSNANGQTKVVPNSDGSYTIRDSKGRATGYIRPDAGGTRETDTRGRTQTYTDKPRNEGRRGK